MAGFIGMDPELTKALASKMTKTAETINQAVQSLTGSVDGVQWKGQDAERFKQDWKGTCVPSIRKVAEMLRTHATNLNQQVQQQIDATSR